MPQIGPLEILVVSVIALIVFGPQRLPEIARSIGRALNEFKRQASDIRSEFESGLDVADEPEQPGPVTPKGPVTPTGPGAEAPPQTTPVARLPEPASEGTAPSSEPPSDTTTPGPDDRSGETPSTS